MNSLLILCQLLAAGTFDSSCVFLLHGDGEPPWSSSSWIVTSIQNHGAKRVEGRFNDAVWFDGESAYLDGGQFFASGFCFPQQTISLWVRPEREGKLEGVLGSQEKPGQSSWRWSLVRELNGAITFQFYDNAQTESPRREVRSNTNARAGEWIHLAVVIDTSTNTTSLYLNGKKEGSGRVQSNVPYGKLIVGHSLGGPFQGSVDELAIFERAFSDEEVAELADQSHPLANITPRQWSGFWLRPQADTPYMGLWHSELPHSQWVLRVTEYAYFDRDGDRNVGARDVKWTVAPDGKSAQFHWAASDDLKQQVGLDFWGEYQAEGDSLDFTITGKNVGTEKWDRSRLSLVCLISGGAPMFIDYEAQRTFIHRGQDFVTMNEVVDGKFASHRMCGVIVRRDGDEPVSRLASKLSADGKWVLGLAVDRAGSLSFNFQPRTSCIHSNPAWPLLRPGGQATATGRMYLFKGTLEDLWKRFSRDFEAK